MKLILQKGNYSLPQRLSTVLYRGAQFFTVGFVSSGLGHSLTKWAVEKKQAANPKQVAFRFAYACKTISSLLAAL